MEPTILTKQWEIAAPIPTEIQAKLSDHSPIMQQILYNRGVMDQISSAHYLNAQLPTGTDPFSMLGVPQAADRVWWAITHQEPVVIYGDYDADGVTSTALLTLLLQSLGANVRGYIPDRFEEGYGLNKKALESLYIDGIRLVISVDCGIRSLKETEYANDLGLDLIITDHHNPGLELPNALAVINPKQPGEIYPSKDLAGVGIAYKLGQALVQRLTQGNNSTHRQFEAQLAEDFLDLVAIGTIADLTPLVGENRALVHSGLIRMRRNPRQGLGALMRATGLNPQKISANDIGFGIGPRLNAAGRLESADKSLRLLLTQNRQEAALLAQQLDDLNRTRQKIMGEIQSHAEKLALEEDPDASLLFAVDSSFNQGVVGLAASRLTEQYYRPAIVANKGEAFSRGSCRSIPEFHITEALDQCQDLLVRHGGHAAAAGFTVENDNLQELKRRLGTIADLELSDQVLQPTIHADLEIPLSELTPDLLRDLDKLQPTGRGNPQSVFISRNVQVNRCWTVGKDKSHLRLVLTNGYITFDAIAFRQGHWERDLPANIDIAYNFELNEFNGRQNLQLNIKDIKPTNKSIHEPVFN
ncbi:single-stranded-DNA-specific exonuclease RecJ [Chloroflexota bacterium]